MVPLQQREGALPNCVQVGFIMKFMHLKIFVMHPVKVICLPGKGEEIFFREYPLSRIPFSSCDRLLM
jgi:hypothetical protein